MGTVLSILWICLLIWSVGAALRILPAPFFVHDIHTSLCKIIIVKYCYDFKT